MVWIGRYRANVGQLYVVQQNFTFHDDDLGPLQLAEPSSSNLLRCCSRVVPEQPLATRAHALGACTTDITRPDRPAICWGSHSAQVNSAGQQLRGGTTWRHGWSGTTPPPPLGIGRVPIPTDDLIFRNGIARHLILLVCILS